MKIGDMIKIHDDYKEAIASFRKKEKCAGIAFSNAAWMLEGTNTDLWDFVKHTHPELKGWALRLTEDGKGIQIIRKEVK